VKPNIQISYIALFGHFAWIGAAVSICWIHYFQARAVHLTASCKKSLVDEYENDPDYPAVSKHRKTGDRVCGSCLKTDGIVSPVARTDFGFQCLKHKVELLKLPNPEDSAKMSGPKRHRFDGP
jgi:hypothetical protein